MSILIEVKKKHLYIMGLMLAVFLGALLVNGYNSGGPPGYVGHSSEELNITLSKLQGIVSNDFHNLGGTDNVNDGDTSSSNEIQDLGDVVNEGGCTNCITGTHVSESTLSGSASSLQAGACNADSICETTAVQTSQKGLRFAGDAQLYEAQTGGGLNGQQSCDSISVTGNSQCLACVRESDGVSVGCGSTDLNDCLCWEDIN